MDGRRSQDAHAGRRSDPAQRNEPQTIAATISPSLVTRAAADLLDAIELGISPLRAISDALTDLADAAGAQRVIASVDHATLGRQIFCSRRSPLGDAAEALFGDQCVRVEPPAEIEANAERALLAATRVALGSLATTSISMRRNSSVAALRDVIEPAVANALGNQWVFTLVLVHCDRPHKLTEPIEIDTLRAGDRAFILDDRELAVMLPMASGQDVTAALAHHAHRLALPTLSYGVAHCPTDATTCDKLLQTAAERLRTTIIIRDAPESDERAHDLAAWHDATNTTRETDSNSGALATVECVGPTLSI